MHAASSLIVTSALVKEEAGKKIHLSIFSGVLICNNQFLSEIHAVTLNTSYNNLKHKVGGFKKSIPLLILRTIRDVCFTY